MTKFKAALVAFVGVFAAPEFRPFEVKLVRAAVVAALAALGYKFA